MMMSSSPPRKHSVLFYIYAGLAFLLWENLVSSFLGIYNLELRRTVWGIIYYSLLFLVFGGLTEGFNFLYSRLCPEHRWFGQKYICFLMILVTFLWGDASRQLLINLFDIQSERLSYELNLIWLPFAAIVGWVGSIILAKLARTGRLANSPRMTIYFYAAILYLIVSTKVTYRYFQLNIFLTSNLLLQPIFILGSLVLSLIIVRLFTSARTFRRALITVPIILTIAVVCLPAGYKTLQKAEIYPSQPPSDHPNIIILLFDALRGDHVGPNAEGYSLTPTIDSLAQYGKAYRSCYSTSSWTFPSVVSLFTSKLPNKLGMVEKGLLPEEFPTVGDILKRNGYYTAGLSANDLITSRFGFDHSFDEFHFLHGKGLKQLFLPFRSFFPSFRLLEELAYQFGFVSVDLNAAEWEQMNQRVADLIEKAGSEPFFLYMHFIEPHAPYWTVPFEDGILDLEQLKLSYYFGRYRTGKISPEDFFVEDIMSAAETQHERYLNGVRTADRATSDLLRTLDRMGWARNTVIIIMSDHGEEFLEHGGSGHKSTLFEELVRIPLVIYIPPELQINLPDQPTAVSTLDIAPTVLDLAGVDTDIPDRDGWTLLQSYPDAHRPKYMMVEVMNVFWSAVVLEPYKLILKEHLKNGKVDTLLFNLCADEKEKVNLYPGEKYIADSLAVYLQEQLEQTITTPQDPPRALTPHEIQRLRALGYVN